MKRLQRKGEKMSRDELRADTGPRVLPIVRLADTAYFVDLRLRQFRETMNPHNYVDFDSARGKAMCRRAGVVTCLHCGASAIVAASAQKTFSADPMT